MKYVLSLAQAASIQLAKVKKRKPFSSPSASRISEGPQPKATARLSLAKKVAFSAVATLLLLALMEVVLALCGIKPELSEKDPHAGFSPQRPLFVEQTDTNGRTFLVTAKNRLDFFNRQQFPKEKGPGVYRIFSMGGSTTYGHPYDDTTSFNGWLREFLGAMASERRWEVINTGGISYGS
jgi:hypothetical protein